MSFQCWNDQQVSYFRQETQAYLEPSQKSNVRLGSKYAYELIMLWTNFAEKFRGLSHIIPLKFS